MEQTNKILPFYSPETFPYHRHFDEYEQHLSSKESEEFSLKIGGTTYEVSTHFNATGKENVLEQFKRLILLEKLI